MPQWTAMTRGVSPSFAECELTYQQRLPIDLETARAQHAAYERALAEAGCAVFRIAADPACPDAVFVEDTAIVLDEVAVIARPGAASRRPEVPAVEEALKSRRLLTHITEPGTLDGGDVLVIGRTMFVGASRRSNAAGIAQLRTLMGHFGYRVETIALQRCLHLKSAVTAIGDHELLLNPDRLPDGAFAGFDCLEVDPSEPDAANVLRLGGRVIAAAAFPRTRERLESHGLEVIAVDVGEFAKAEGAITCCSLILREVEP